MNTSGTTNLKRKVAPNKNNELNVKAPKLNMKPEEPTVELKTMKKYDLISYCENLLAQNQNLIADNKKLNEIKEKQTAEIDALQKSVKDLKDKCANTPVYLCGDCDYLADCIHDFNDHTHSPDDFNESDLQCFQCNFCEDTFESISEVMIHNKQVHTSNVQHCDKFLEDECYYGENCWFLHSENYRKSASDLNCRKCNSKFKSKSRLMEHMKTNHMEFVKHCKHQKSKCKYGPEKCWFIHDHDIEKAYNQARNINNKL